MSQDVTYCPCCASRDIIVDDQDGEAVSIYHGYHNADIYVSWFICGTCKQQFGIV